MNTDQLITTLRPLAVRPTEQSLRSAVAAAQDSSEAGQQAVCGAMIWTAFAAPAATSAVYDVLTSAWLGTELASPGLRDGLDSTEAPLTDNFWKEFAGAVAGAEQGYDAASITARVAALGGAVDAQFHELAERAASQHPGVTDAVQREIPPLLKLTDLARCPEGCLAADLYHMLVDNGYDAEVLDREAIGLANLPPALGYTNTRILQMHDIWHLMAGYQTTSLHEIAISSFQLAQFGHNYSSMFLATVATISQSRAAAGFGLFLQNICEAWLHGRNTPSFMDIPWEKEWRRSVKELRTRHGIEPFKGSFPADLLEQLKAAAA